MKIGVIGAGAWGTALAQVAAAGGEDVVLWAREGEVVTSINAMGENVLFLPGVRLAPSIRATVSLDELYGSDVLLVVTPAQHLRAVLSEVAPGADALVLCSKGIEERSGLMMHEVAEAVQPGSAIAVLSGPTFAHEVAKGLPTAVTLAIEEATLGQSIAARIARPNFRPYLSDDLAGAEVGGAVKNVLAIACGVVEGLGLGLNARAALISRGFAEMTRFGIARGAKMETLTGLAGLGDLVLTCSSTQSRNFSLGVGLGQGKPARELLADRRTVAEGAFTAPVLLRVAQASGVEMPIAAAVGAMLKGEIGAGEAVEQLLARPLRAEGV